LFVSSRSGIRKGAEKQAGTDRDAGAGDVRAPFPVETRFATRRAGVGIDRRAGRPSAGSGPQRRCDHITTARFPQPPPPAFVRVLQLANALKVRSVPAWRGPM